MSIVAAIDAVYEKLRADGLTAVQLENLQRALPARGQRTQDEINVAIAISKAYRDELRPVLQWAPCRVLAAELRQHVGPDGRYVAALGQPLDMVSDRTDLIVRELERRHSCDFFELFEASGADLELAGDTDAYTKFEVAEVERRCASLDRLHCGHN